MSIANIRGRCEVIDFGSKAWVKGFASMAKNQRKLLDIVGAQVVKHMSDTVYSRGIKERSPDPGQKLLRDSITHSVSGDEIHFDSSHFKAFQFEYGMTEKGEDEIRAKNVSGYMMIPTKEEYRYTDDWREALRTSEWEPLRGKWYLAESVSIPRIPFAEPAIEEYLDSGDQLEAAFGEHVFSFAFKGA